MSNLPDNFNRQAFEDRYGVDPRETIADQIDTAWLPQAFAVLARHLGFEGIEDAATDAVGDALSLDDIDGEDNRDAALEALDKYLCTIDDAMERLKLAVAQHKAFIARRGRLLAMADDAAMLSKARAGNEGDVAK